MSSIPPNPPAGKPTVSAPLLPPRVPDHELLQRIGRGAYGEVWLARSVTGAFRAVKIVHRQTFDHDRPFEREFEGILKFEPVSRLHESQVDILHVGRGDDCFYYVMELADDQVTGGQIDPDHYAPRTLKSEVLFRGRVPFEECVRIGLALATALENLHGNGLVHRDVKPSNIIFVNGVPKLADIGLVAGVEATRSHVGTDGFAAPEGAGSPQADLYSLGKVLYEISTGKDRQEFPELPTQLRELPDREGLVELNAVIARACRHHPKERYATATAMRTDLEVLQSGRSLARLHRVEKQLRVVRRAGVLVTALAALIATGWLWQARQTGIVRRLATENARLAEEKDRVAEENRRRLVRLDIANGVRLLDEGDPSAALLWFAEALPLATNRPAEEAIHRIRIQQAIEQTPRLLNVIGEGTEMIAGAFSPDGLRIVTSTLVVNDHVKVAMRDAKSGRVHWERRLGCQWTRQIHFTRDGQRLLVCSPADHLAAGSAELGSNNRIAMVLDAHTGESMYPQSSSNQVCSAFSPDDRWLALALTNHVIQLFDTKSGRSVVEIGGHTNQIISLAFSDDGNLLVSGARDGTARIWRVSSGELVRGPFAHDQPVRRAVLSGDGRRLATASWGADDEPEEGRVQVWDAENGRPIGPALRTVGWLSALAFSPGAGTRFIMADKRYEIDVRDSVSLERLYPPLKMSSTARCWEFSPDGMALAIGNNDGSTYVWGLESGKLLHPRFHYNGWVESVHFSPDGSRLLTLSDDGGKLWDLGMRAESTRLQFSTNLDAASDHDPSIRGRIPGPIPVRLSDKSLHLVDPERLVDVQVLQAMETNATLVNWSGGSSGRCWAVTERPKGATHQDTVALWLNKAGSWRRLALSHPDHVAVIAFNADESRLFTFGADSQIRIWRTIDGEMERSISVPKSLWVIKNENMPDPFRPDRGALLLGFGKGRFMERLQLFDLATGELTGKPILVGKIRGDCNRWRFSPDGSRIIAVGDNQCGSIIDLQTGELAVAQFKHGATLFDLDWSPDGKRLITAGLSPETKLWDAATGEMLLSPMAIGDKPAMAARWSADGSFIVTRSDDNQARVWDASTAEAVTPLLRHAGYIRWACITRGKRLITASDPNLLRAWDLKPTPLAADVIADYAALLSGRRLNASGVLLTVRASELAQLGRSLRTRAPQLFER